MESLPLSLHHWRKREYILFLLSSELRYHLFGLSFFLIRALIRWNNLICSWMLQSFLFLDIFLPHESVRANASSLPKHLYNLPSFISKVSWKYFLCRYTLLFPTLNKYLYVTIFGAQDPFLDHFLFTGFNCTNPHMYTCCLE